MDYITRKATREFNKYLWKDAKFNKKDTENPDEMAEKIEFNPYQVSVGTEKRAYEMIDRIVLVQGEEEKTIEKSEDWWDNMPEYDAELIDSAVTKIANESDKKAKKS